MKITFGQRLFLPLLLSWICLLAVFAVSALQERSLRLAERKTQLANAGEMAASIASDYGTLVERGAMNEGEAKRQALARIKALRFGASGFMVVFDGNTVLMHPVKPELVGSRRTGLVSLRWASRRPRVVCGRVGMTAVM